MGQSKSLSRGDLELTGRSRLCVFVCECVCVCLRPRPWLLVCSCVFVSSVSSLIHTWMMKHPLSTYFSLIHSHSCTRSHLGASRCLTCEELLAPMRGTNLHSSLTGTPITRLPDFMCMLCLCAVRSVIMFGCAHTYCTSFT